MIFKAYKIASGIFAILSIAVILCLLLVDSFKVLSSIHLSKFVMGSWNPSSGEYNLLPMAMGGTGRLHGIPFPRGSYFHAFSGGAN